MSKLFKPITIGTMTVKNRMILPPMNTNYSSENGAVTQQMTAFYMDKAKKGVGLIVVEAASVATESKNHDAQPMICEERFIPGWFNLNDQLHQYNVKTSVELVHYGSEGERGEKAAPSNVTKHSGQKNHVLSISEVESIEDQFAEAVRWAQIAGFDAATLHAAHGFLIAEFISPIYNTRTDIYGGSLENRMRFLINILRKAKAKVGRFPIIVRYCADEFCAGGREVEESVQIGRMLEMHGVAALDISSGLASSYSFNMRPYSLQPLEGFNMDTVRCIKSHVAIPVFYAGGIREIDMAKEIVDGGYADMVCLGRALLADDQFCMKAQEKVPGPVRYCLSCQECLKWLDAGRSLRCAVNPRTGREFFLGDELEKAAVRKSVVVVGSGPAGLEAALVAAKRGHSVTVYEAENDIGGTLRAAAVPPGKHRIRDLIEYYRVQLTDLNVKILLHRTYTRELAMAEKPDAIVFAGGAQFFRKIPGSEGDTVITAVEALTHPERVGKHIVIIGGGASGCEIADYFCNEAVQIRCIRVADLSGAIEYEAVGTPEAKQREISIVEMLPELCSDVDEYNRPILCIKLRENGVYTYLGARVESIEVGAVRITDASGQSVALEADTVILAAGMKPRETFSIEGVDCYCIGDHAAVGKIKDAIFDGHSVGLQL